ncbi:Clavaminate synthase-like protein [Xylaria digitata]|nr:Clavaminate synthase-like protein [Xylaria digitata]
MSVATVLGRSLRLIPRNIYRAPKHGLQRQGLYFGSRQLSLSGQQPLIPSLALGEDNQITSTPPPIKKPIRRMDRTDERNRYFWQTDLRVPTSPISFHIASSAEPLVASRTWLRDSCTCERCVDSSSGQKRYASTDVPSELHISALEVTKDGDLQVHFEKDFLTHDTHVSTYPRKIWRHPSQRSTEATPKLKLWHRESLAEASPYYSYQSFMTSDSVYFDIMTALRLYGIVFLVDVPPSEEVVKDIAGKIGVIQDTFYGTTWDVRSKPNAENVAYTNSYLGLHQDLLYMYNVPRIQLLHCLKNTCEGGESLFSDGYRAAHQFRRHFARQVRYLTERRLTYHYNKGGHSYQQSRAILSEDSKESVYWSPPFQHPVQPDNLTQEGMHKFGEWQVAARNLKTMFESWSNVYQHKMHPGQIAIFDNLRVLHGRCAFDSSGERWLKGAYVENSSYESRLKSLGIA